MTLETKVKLFVKGILEGTFVTILMSLVTIFCLIGVSSLSIRMIVFTLGRYKTYYDSKISRCVLQRSDACFYYSLLNGSTRWKRRS